MCERDSWRGKREEGGCGGRWVCERLAVDGEQQLITRHSLAQHLLQPAADLPSLACGCGLSRNTGTRHWLSRDHGIRGARGDARKNRTAVSRPSSLVGC